MGINAKFVSLGEIRLPFAFDIQLRNFFKVQFNSDGNRTFCYYNLRGKMNRKIYLKLAKYSFINIKQQYISTN